MTKKANNISLRYFWNITLYQAVQSKNEAYVILKHHIHLLFKHRDGWKRLNHCQNMQNIKNLHIHFTCVKIYFLEQRPLVNISIWILFKMAAPIEFESQVELRRKRDEKRQAQAVILQEVILEV